VPLAFSISIYTGKEFSYHPFNTIEPYVMDDPLPNHIKPLKLGNVLT